MRFWLALPYYRGFDYGRVKDAMTEVTDLWHGVLSNLLKASPSFKISYKNAYGNLEARLGSGSSGNSPIGAEWRGGWR